MHDAERLGPRGARGAPDLERQLDRARRRRRRDARPAARLRARLGRRCALGGDRRRPAVLRGHQAPPQPAARHAGRRRAARRRRARGLRGGAGAATPHDLRRAGRARRHRDPARPADRRADPARARARRAGHLALPRRARRAERPRARGLVVPGALRRCRPTPTCSRARRSSGTSSTRPSARSSRPRSTSSRPRTPSSTPAAVDAILAAAGLRRGRAGAPSFQRAGRTHRAGPAAGDAARDAPARAGRPLRAAGLALGLAQGPDRRDRGVRRARRPVHRRAPDLRRAGRDRGGRRSRGRGGLRVRPRALARRCPPRRASASISRCCRWRTSRRTP